MTDPWQRRPPEHTLRWAAEAISSAATVASVRRLALGGWHVNHALTVNDGAGKAHRLVLRRWARPHWAVEDPDLTAAREATVLELLAPTPVPAPRLIAADPDATICDVPTLLISHLPGHPPGLPADIASFLARLAEALPTIHAVDPRAVPDYRTDRDLSLATPPTWSRQPELWQQALDVVGSEPPPGPRCFIHRDYHPENTLWSGGQLTAIVDWTQASRGPAAVDTAHMRWNLGLTYGLDAADEVLRVHQSLAGAFEDQSYWDLTTALDVLIDPDPTNWTRFDIDRLERYLHRVLTQVA